MDPAAVGGWVEGLEHREVCNGSDVMTDQEGAGGTREPGGAARLRVSCRAERGR